MKEYCDIRKEIIDYLFKEIVPRYASFDPAHQEDHAKTVIEQSMSIMDSREEWIQDNGDADEWGADIDREMLLTAAAYHDLGLANGRERHHLDSGNEIRNDLRLKEWFDMSQIEVMAQAAEDHRASGKSAPRSIYGMIIAEADRVIDTETIIRRTIQFGLKHYPDLGKDGHISRAIAHLKEKYGRGGYLKLWIPWSDNASRLNILQDLIDNEEALLYHVTRFAEEYL